MCNKSVDFLIRRDKDNNLLFAPLQGETAAKILDKKYIRDLDSMAIWINGKVYTKSTAILKSAQLFGGVWKLSGIFFIIPMFIRDWIYDIVAKSRYTIFGKMESCRIPTIDEREKILN